MCAPYLKKKGGKTSYIDFVSKIKPPIVTMDTKYPSDFQSEPTSAPKCEEIGNIDMKVFPTLRDEKKRNMFLLSSFKKLFLRLKNEGNFFFCS